MYSIKNSTKKINKPETPEELLVMAIVNGNADQVKELLKDNNDLLNKVLPAKLPNPAKPRTPIKLAYTALGCAIELGQQEIVALLLSFEKLSLRAGNILIADAEDFAKHRKQENIANLITARKLQDKLKNLALKKSSSAENLPENIESAANMQAEEQDVLTTKLYEYLSNNQLDLAERILQTASTQLSAKPAEDAIVFRFIDLFILETKHTRWILRQNNKEEVREQSRDDLLNENQEDVIARKEKRNKKLKLIRLAIDTLAPNVKQIKDKDLEKFYASHVKQQQQYFADESDDSDSEDEELLANNNNPKYQTQRASEFKEIQSTINANQFWHKSIREKFINKLSNIVENKVITEQEIKAINKTIFAEKRTREELQAFNNPHGQLFVAQFRGINYMADRWNTSSRRYHYKMNETNCDQFSESVLRQLPYNFYSELNQENDYYNTPAYSQILAQNSHQAKQAYKELQATGPMVEECIALKNTPYLFNNAADFLQTGYTNGISQHLLELKRYRQEKLGNIEQYTLNSFNYAISTSDCPNHALRYALGLKTYYADNFAVRYNKNGKIINSHVGKVYIILQTLEEFNLPNHINHVLRMAHEARVPISKVGGVDIASELENDFIGYIPGKNVVYQLRLKFPDFSRSYKSIYATKYGMNKELYTDFAELIKKTWGNDPANSAHQAAIQLLKEWLCYYYEILLLQIAQNKTINLGGNLVYVRHDGTEAFTPDYVPLNPGDAHLADRNTVHVLQNFRAIVANKQAVINNQSANIDEIIDEVLSDNFKQLSAMVAAEPRNPGGFGKIASQNDREFYLNSVLNIDDHEDKKKVITGYVLNQNKSTLMPDVNVATPFLFSRKRTTSNANDVANDKSLKTQKLSI